MSIHLLKKSRKVMILHHNCIDQISKLLYFQNMKTANKALLDMTFDLAKETKAKAVLVHIDALDNLKFGSNISKDFRLILVSKKKNWDFTTESKDSLGLHSDGLIVIPKIALSRVGIIKIAATLALSLEYIAIGDKIICVVGQSSGNCLDNIQIIDTGKETELLTGREIIKISESVKPEIFQAVLGLSIELASKGREGKPIGTIFVVGDEDHVMQLSKQMIINPFKGYDENERNILAPSLKDTIREISAMDGAFVISNDGIILTAGRYLGAASKEEKLPRGLGSRHLAAAGITALTNAVAFVISESSGDVRIFKNGKIVMEIQKQ